MTNASLLTLEQRTTSLQNKTIVITGASSGIGFATALAFAREHANVVVAARRSAALERIAVACRQLGGRALAVPMDVTETGAAERLAEAAIAQFGGIDVWINNAGAGAFGRFEETPLAAHEQVLQINLLGYVRGAHAVLPHFKARGAGILINNISLGAWAPVPGAASYSASKFGLHGFSRALRGELGRFPDIHVCAVYPAMIDTPAFGRGGNYSGRVLKPTPPVYDPRKVARAFVKIAKHPQPETTVGSFAIVARAVHALAPMLATAVFGKLLDWHLDHGRPAPKTNGNLFAARSTATKIDGGMRHRLHGQALGVAVALASVGLARYVWSRRRLQPFFSLTSAGFTGAVSER